MTEHNMSELRSHAMYAKFKLRRDRIDDVTATVAAAPGARTQDQSLPQRHFFRQLFRQLAVTEDANSKHASRGVPMPTGTSSYDGVASAARDADDALLNQAYQAHVDHAFYDRQCDQQLTQDSPSSNERRTSNSSNKDADNNGEQYAATMI